MGFKEVLNNYKKDLGNCYQSQKNLVDLGQHYLNELEKAYEGGSGTSTMDIVAEETEVGTYLGEKLYRKIYNITAFPNNTTITYDPVISNFKRFIVPLCSGEAIFASGDIGPLPYPISDLQSQNFITLVFKSNGTFTCATKSDRSNVSGTVILYYTKTA